MPAYPVQAATFIAATPAASNAGGQPSNSPASVPTRSTNSTEPALPSNVRPFTRLANQAVTGAEQTTPASIAALYRPAAGSPPRPTAIRMKAVQPSDRPNESSRPA